MGPKRQRPHRFDEAAAFSSLFLDSSVSRLQSIHIALVSGIRSRAFTFVFNPPLIYVRGL